ncbi:MAG: alpha/beta hydrolase [Kiritimatiellae bacterium]|nr:alpha/beta hydrolase [Kiritimatiellia bacterium]
MTLISDIRYSTIAHPMTVGDLYLPKCPEGAPAALLIHGGSWRSLDKQHLANVATMLVELGYGVFSINYRLVTNAPWPACREDCMAAARFLADARRSAMRPLNRRRLLIVGATAGGHLALMTGLRLPREQVAGIVSLAAVTDLRSQISATTCDAFPEAFWRRFFGSEDVSPTMRLEASPVAIVPPHPPPLLCIHNVFDDQIRMEQSEHIIAACREQGGQAELFSFNGPPKEHGFWLDPAAPSPRLLPAVETAIEQFTRNLLDEV